MCVDDVLRGRVCGCDVDLEREHVVGTDRDSVAAAIRVLLAVVYFDDILYGGSRGIGFGFSIQRHDVGGYNPRRVRCVPVGFVVGAVCVALNWNGTISTSAAARGASDSDPFGSWR